MVGSWLYRCDAVWLATALATTMVLAAWLGALWARRGARAEESPARIGSIEAALFALLGLMLAFTFAAAASRADARRELTIAAANAIGTSALRADLYPPTERAGFRREMLAYLAARMAFQKAGIDATAVQEALRQTDVAESRLWARAMRLAADHPTATMLMVPALNEMFDLASSRLAANRTRVPDLVLWVLLVLASATAFASGHSTAQGGRFPVWAYVGLALLTALVVYAVLDLDRPNRGLVTLRAQYKAFDDVAELLRD